MLLTHDRSDENKGNSGESGHTQFPFFKLL